MNNVIDNLLWVELSSPDDFLKIRETLTRIGIASKKEKTLTQSCHILHKRGRYAIVHFKELFALDGKYADITDEDVGRRNMIAKLLESWGLLTFCQSNPMSELTVPMHTIKVISYKEKGDWNLVTKYTVGNKKSGGTMHR